MRSRYMVRVLPGPLWQFVEIPRCLQTIFIESYVDDPKIIEQNVRSVKISSPDVSYQLVYMTGGCC